MRKLLLYGIVVMLMSTAPGCIQREVSSPEFQYEETLMLEDLAYSRRGEAVYKVEVEEYGEPVPYLVLTDDYTGNCLLLRENLLDEGMRYGPPKWHSAYYGDSEIDGYLMGNS